MIRGGLSFRDERGSEFSRCEGVCVFWGLSFRDTRVSEFSGSELLAFEV